MTISQPSLFDTLPAVPVKVPHPGSACCDPAQDLAGWIAAQRARIALDRLSLAAYTADRADDDHSDTGRDLDMARRNAHGKANDHAVRAMMLAATVDRIEAAHQHRLNPDGAPA